MSAPESAHLLPKRPPRQRAVQRRAVDTIDAVIEETIRVLESEGESAVRIANISAVTGVSYGAIYHHFRDRDGLIRAAQFARLQRQPRSFTAPMAQAFDQIETQATDPTVLVDIMRDIARTIADPQRQAIRLVRINVLAAAQSRPELRAAVMELERRIMEDVHRLVVRAQGLGVVSFDLDPRAVATFLESIAFGVVLQEYFGETPDPEALAEVVFRAFLSLVQGRP